MERRYMLGLYEKSMPDTLNWNEKFAAGREAGFDTLEISIDESDFRLSRLAWTREERKKLLELSRYYDFYINTMCLSGHRKYPLGSGIAEIEAQSLKIMEEALELSYDLGIRIIQLAGYDVYYNEKSTPSTKERFFRNLVKSTAMASSRGVILALETMENSFLNTVEKAMYYVQMINSPYLKVYPDIGNITNATENVGRDLRMGKGSIVAAHLKETIPNVYRNMKFGEGNVDFGMAAGVLQSMGVSLFTAEFWYDGSKNWRETLRQSNCYLRRFLN